MTRHATIAALIAALAFAGCGGGIESTVRDQYGDYAKQHGFKGATRNVDRVECTHEATRDYDGWCRIHPKGYPLTYDVPYRGDKPLWGESGLLKAPGS